MSSSLQRSCPYTKTPSDTSPMDHAPAKLAKSPMAECYLLRWKQILYFNDRWTSTSLAKAGWALLWELCDGNWPWGSPSIMVWGGIGLNSKLGPVVFQNLGPGRGNSVSAARYRDQVLTSHVVPHFNRHPNKTFQQDNARAHTARVTRDYLQQHSITAMDWPALSPDPNPIEHLLDHIQLMRNRQQPRSTTAA